MNQSGQALAQVAWKGCKVSNLGEGQNPPGHGPGSLLLVVLLEQKAPGAAANPS